MQQQLLSLTVLQSYRERSKMENKKLLVISLCFFLYAIMICDGIEMPQFTVVHSESDFEIRLYRESAWMSAEVQEISFEKATRGGFHRLYQYIHGANSNSSELEMTAPVLTSIAPVAQSVEHYVKFYLPTEFQDAPPDPLPELNLQFSKLRSHCVAVRQFSGFAMDDSIGEEVEALVSSVGKSQNGNSTILEDKRAYTIAQYNASFHLSERVNEVWMGVLAREEWSEVCFAGILGAGGLMIWVQQQRCRNVIPEGPESFCGYVWLFQYIEGANLNNSRVSMTVPVLTSIAREAGPLHSSAYVVQFYLPVKFQDSPPLPLPELKLEPHVWTSHCIAVRKFSGFARDGNVIAEAKKLALSLSRSPWANSTSSDGKYAYSIAQYNSPFRLIGRVNEVWVDIDGSETEGCASGGDVATY